MRRLLVIACVALLVASCIDEKAIVQAFAPKDHDELARRFLERLGQGDYTAVQGFLMPAVAASTTTADIEKLAQIVNHGAPVAVELIGANVGIFRPHGGEATRQSNLTYQLQFAEAWVLATFVITTTPEGPRVLSGNLQPLPGSLRDLNRFTLQNKSLVHYLFLGAMLAAVLLIVVAIVVCARSKVRRRWLWLIFIVLAFGRLQLNWTTGQWNFAPISIMLLGAGFFRASSYAPFVMSVGLPVGAIVFLLVRGHLPRKGPPDLPPSTPAPPPPLL